MTSPFRISQLVLNSGDVIDTSDADIVVLVGPNNSGKSRVLVETQQTLGLEAGRNLHPSQAFVLGSLGVSAQLDQSGFVRWMREHRTVWVEPNDSRERFHTIGAGDILADHATSWWNDAGRFFQLSQHLVRSLFCQDRLGYLGAPGRPAPGQRLDHPVQKLAMTPHLLEQFRSAFRTAFRQEVIVDAWGPNVQLRVSPHFQQDDFTATSAMGLPPNDLLERLAAVPTIETQSDGVRSFAGILLTLLTMDFPLVLLDEPEAFLHPPQARLLGRYLSTLPHDGQLFVATHSLDILLGLIQGRPDRVKIVRLTRSDGQTHARTLAPFDLQRIWSDPLLRFSRALDGLFHEGVVICEGDTDSLFYSAVADSGATESALDLDVMFTFAGSKHRIALVADALRALGVPVAAIADFDALNDRGVIERLVASLGGVFSVEGERQRSLVDAGLRGSHARVTDRSVAEPVSAVLAATGDQEVTSRTIQEVRHLLEPETGWRAAKKAGSAVVPSGDATVALQAVLEELRRNNLFVVPSGAVESFVKAVPSKGPRWVVDVVEGGHLGDATYAQSFVAEVVASLRR